MPQKLFYTVPVALTQGDGRWVATNDALNIHVSGATREEARANFTSLIGQMQRSYPDLNSFRKHLDGAGIKSLLSSNSTQYIEQEEWVFGRLVPEEVLT